MTNRRIILKAALIATMVCALVACSKDDDGVDVDPNNDTSEPVQDNEKTETAVEQLNAAAAEGKIAQSVTPLTNDGKTTWVIEFTDGTSIQFADNDKNIPTPYATIGNDGSWYVSEDYGEYYTLLKSADGQPIKTSVAQSTAEKVISENIVPKQKKHNDGIDAIAEDNTGNKLSIALSSGPIITLQKSANTLQSFSISAADNKNIVPQDLNYVIGSNRLTVITPYHIDKSKITARFTTATGNKVYVNGVVQTSGSSANDFTNGAEYQVVSPDGNTNKYIITIQNTGLPIVCINTPNNAAINSKEVWMENAKITIYNADGTVDYENEQLQIRGRGNSTWGYPKKPYALKLEKKAEILGMPKHKRWVLLANWMDRTLLRNDFAFEISRHTGLDFTPNGQFVEVVLNGKHIGNYYLCEQVKADKNRVNITEMKPEDISGAALTGGYILELDVYYDEKNKFRSEKRNLPYMVNTPDDDELQPAQFDYIRNYINEFERTLYADNWLTSKKYKEYLELESFADWWMVFELSGNWEPNHPKSVFMHKDRNGKLAIGPVWDFDWETFVPKFTDNFTIKGSLYYGQLFKDPEFETMVKNRWRQQRSEFSKIPEIIRQRAKALRHSERFNDALWHTTSDVNGDKDMSFDDAVERMITCYKQKYSFLDSKL